MKKGDIVVCALQGDYGKPRSAVIVQSDLFNPTHASLVVCPITSHLVEAPLFRLPIKPNKLNKLTYTTHIMVDKITAIKKERIQEIIGKLLPEELNRLDEALKLWLSI
jgi:mRNA interferase MazF